MRWTFVCTGFFLFFTVFFTAFPACALQITEIMYDAVGTDTDYEWIEIYNNDSTSYSISALKLFEANTNHAITSVSGEDTLSVGSYAIIASNATAFSQSHGSFSGILTDSSFSLANTGEAISIKQNDTVLVSVTYDTTIGAAGDGNTLSLSGGQWVSAVPTPGQNNAGASQPEQNNNESENDSDTNSASQATAKTNEAVPVYSLSVTTDPVVIAGNMHVFTAHPIRSVGSDIFKLRSGVYEWAMGDGSGYLISNNPELPYTYEHAGTYQMVLRYYSSKVTYKNDSPLFVLQKKITVVRPTITVRADTSGNVILSHNGKDALDVSGWSIVYNDMHFVFPRSTLLLNGTVYTLGPKKLGFMYAGGVISLQYPNKTVYTSYQDKKSAARISATGVSGTSFVSSESLVTPAQPFTTENQTTALAIDAPNKNNALFILLGFFALLITVVTGLIYTITRSGHAFIASQTPQPDTDDYSLDDNETLPSEEIIELSDD